MSEVFQCVGPTVILKLLLLIKCINNFHGYMTVFNTDNNHKCFLIIILERFLKGHVTLKTGVMMLKIQE